MCIYIYTHFLGIRVYMCIYIYIYNHNMYVCMHMYNDIRLCYSITYYIIAYYTIAYVMQHDNILQQYRIQHNTIS